MDRSVSARWNGGRSHGASFPVGLTLAQGRLPELSVELNEAQGAGWLLSGPLNSTQEVPLPHRFCVPLHGKPFFVEKMHQGGHIVVFVIL